MLNGCSRDGRKGGKSGHGLRCKSLVLAAVTALVEAEVADRERKCREAEEIHMEDELDEEIDSLPRQRCIKAADPSSPAPKTAFLREGGLSVSARSHSDVIL
jgi:hypothetical protein